MRKSEFDGGLLGLIWNTIVCVVIAIITIGIGFPWAVCKHERWYAEHTVIDGKRLTFDGKGSELFRKYIVWFLLTIVTLGIYAFWLNIKMKKWVVEHTHEA